MRRAVLYPTRGCVGDLTLVLGFVYTKNGRRCGGATTRGLSVVYKKLWYWKNM